MEPAMGISIKIPSDVREASQQTTLARSILPGMAHAAGP